MESDFGTVGDIGINYEFVYDVEVGLDGFLCFIDGEFDDFLFGCEVLVNGREGGIAYLWVYGCWTWGFDDRWRRCDGDRGDSMGTGC